MRQKAAALPVPGDLPLRANVNNVTNMFTIKKKKEISELYLSLVDARGQKWDFTGIEWEKINTFILNSFSNYPSAY